MEHTGGDPTAPRTPAGTARGAHRVRSAGRARHAGSGTGRRRTATVLTGVSELLITAGVLVGLFVVWELYWTDLGANRDQAAAVDALAWDGVIPVPVASDQGEPVYPIVPPELVERTDPPPVIDEPATGVTFATLYVPRWGYDYVRPISQGIDRRAVLDKLGIGHYPTTAMPGGLGNFAIAGHRTTYGKPFAHIERLREGDPIIVRTENVWYVYRVTETLIVEPHQVEVVAPVPEHPGEEPDNRYITLTSCHPRYSAAQRYVVHGVLDYWVPAGAGYPAELIPPDQRG